MQPPDAVAGEPHVPGHQRQVAEQGGEDLPLVGVRQQRHQHRPDRRRHRHRPPGGAFTFPREITCAATRPITPGCPVIAYSCCSITPSRAWSAGWPPAWTLPSRRSTAGATATGLQNTTASPVRIFPAPSAVSAVRSPSAAAGAAATAGQPPAPRRFPHPPGDQATHPEQQQQWRETTRQGTNARGTPRIRRGVSNHFSYRESLPKARNHGQTPPRVAPASRRLKHDHAP
jgi:hypothetical protein